MVTTPTTADGLRSVKSSGRVLILLDGSRTSLAALDAAAEIAFARNAEVLGVFVEEVNLLRGAGYGFASEVGGSSGLLRPLEVEVLEARMRALAEQARRALEQAMLRRGVTQALKLCRGRVVEEVLGLIGPDDLVVMGRVGWSGIPGSRLGSTAGVLIHQAPGDVLLWSTSPPLARNRVVVLLNHDQGANHRAVRVGAELARHHQQLLTVLIRAEAGEDQRVVEDVRAYLQSEGIDAKVRLLAMTGVASVVRAMAEEGAAQLVVSRQFSLFGGQGADTLLTELNLPVTVTA